MKRVLIFSILACALAGCGATDTEIQNAYVTGLEEGKIKGFNEYEKEHGVLLRFQGYLAILRRRYDEAERYLKESVEVFERPKLIGTNYFNLAAAYDYLAICARGREDYDKALQYIHKAISICTEKEVQKNLDLFYEDCGYILLLKGDNAQAEQYFLQSIELYGI